MLNKLTLSLCALVLYCVVVKNGDCDVINTDNSTEMPSIIVEDEDSAPQPMTEYKNEDVTQGIGYGHYLHPFYYQGRLQRFYNCALADEWKPFLKATEPTFSNLPVKLNKYNSPKKYYEIKKFNPKMRLFITRRNNGIMRRNDRPMHGEYFMNPHTRFIKDINSLSEDSEYLQNYPYEQPTPQIIVPADAEIVIVKKRANLPMILSPVENVILAPPPIRHHTNNNALHSGPMKVIVSHYKPQKIIENRPFQMPYNRKPINPIAHEVNQASHPYKFVTPLIEDVFRTHYKKPQRIVRKIPMQQSVASSSQVVYKTVVSPPPISLPNNLSFWEKFVLTFFRLAK